MDYDPLKRKLNEAWKKLNENELDDYYDGADPQEIFYSKIKEILKSKGIPVNRDTMISVDNAADHAMEILGMGEYSDELVNWVGEYIENFLDPEGKLAWDHKNNRAVTHKRDNATGKVTWTSNDGVPMPESNSKKKVDRKKEYDQLLAKALAAQGTTSRPIDDTEEAYRQAAENDRDLDWHGKTKTGHYIAYDKRKGRYYDMQHDIYVDNSELKDYGLE